MNAPDNPDITFHAWDDTFFQQATTAIGCSNNAPWAVREKYILGVRNSLVYLREKNNYFVRT